MPSDTPTDFHRLTLFLAWRTGDTDYAHILAMDAFRWARSQAQEGNTVPFGTLLAAAARPAAVAIRERDNQLAQQKSIAGIIAALPRVEREVLRLMYWDQLSMGELADYLGCSIARAGLILDKAYRRAEHVMTRAGLDLAGNDNETT